MVHSVSVVLADNDYSDSGGGNDYGSSGGGNDYGSSGGGNDYGGGSGGGNDYGNTGGGDDGGGSDVPVPPAPLAPLTLSLIFTPNPAIGNAPLQNIDLRAQVAGTAVGDINYQFDCTGDGTWEKEIVSSSADYTAVDLCSYSTKGIVTPKVRITRAGLVIEGTTMVIVK